MGRAGGQLKVAFASCTKVQDLSAQAAWDEIRARRPDALLVLGDKVYLDRDDHVDAQDLGAELRTSYQRQFAQPQFGALQADLHSRGGRQFAVYDNHDFLGDKRCGGDAETGLCTAAWAEFVRAFA